MSAVATSAAASARQPVTLPKAIIQHTLDEMVAATGAPGAVVALRVRGGPVVTSVSGSSDPKLSTPMRSNEIDDVRLAHKK